MLRNPDYLSQSSPVKQYDMGFIKQSNENRVIIPTVTSKTQVQHALFGYHLSGAVPTPYNSINLS